MRSKTLIGVAVASTFAWAAAHAGSGHHAGWASIEEQPPTVMMEEGQSSTALSVESSPAYSAGSTSSEAGGSIGGSFTEGLSSSELADSAPRLDSAGNEVSALERASEGIYSDYYLVSRSPMVMAPQWENYWITFEPEQSDALVLLDDGASDTFVVLSGGNSDRLLLLDDSAYIVSMYDVILLPGDFESQSMREEPAS
jgi:hypothetical protein